jgi:hypothetical protein
VLASFLAAAMCNALAVAFLSVSTTSPSGDWSPILASVIASIGAIVASIVGAILARSARRDIGLNRDELHRLRDLLKAPRKISARAGEDAPMLQPPEPRREDDDRG